MTDLPLDARLRRFRRRHNLTQQAAADLLGVSRQVWSRWERGAPRQHPRVVELAFERIEEVMALSDSTAGGLCPCYRNEPCPVHRQ